MGVKYGMTGISRSPESSLDQFKMPSAWDATMAQGDSQRSKDLKAQAKLARQQRKERLEKAGVREGSQSESSGR